MFQTVKNKVFLFVSLLVGFAFMIFFFVMGIYSVNRVNSYDSKSTAVISRMEYNHTETDDDGNSHDYYDVFVTYEIDGVTYEDMPYDSYSTTMKVGDTVKIRYNAAEPETITSGGTVWIPVIFFAFGVFDLIFLVFKLRAFLTGR